jgi:hypothetical protein
MSRPTSSGCLITLFDVVGLNLERDGPEHRRPVVALDRDLDGDRAGHNLGHRIWRDGWYLRSCGSPARDHAFGALISAH